MNSRPAIIAAAVLFTPCVSHAWEFRVRYVERIGTTDIPLDNNQIDAASLEPRRIRIQFGVFDADSGPAPAGGFIGWAPGVIDVSGAPSNSQERRTPGWLAPFRFASNQYANGNPPPAPGPGGPDHPSFDFQRLTDLQVTTGSQQPNWLCNPDGTPQPMPRAAPLGLNAYVSLYEITINPHEGASNYSITFSGNVFAATEWRLVGDPLPPDCADPANPDDDTPGSVVYAPVPIPPSTFESTLAVLVPAPPALGVACVSCLALMPRRRNRGDAS